MSQVSHFSARPVRAAYPSGPEEAHIDTANITPVVIGSGNIASQHVAALSELGIRPAAVFSPNPGHAAAAGRLFGCPAARDLADALDSYGATHVHICSTPMQHEHAVLEAAARGLTIVCEKPLAPTLVSAARMAGAVRAAGVGAFLTFNRRMDAGVQMMRGAVRDGRLGAPVTIFGSYRQQWNAAPSSRDWRFDPGFVGPSRVVTEIGSHWFDLAEFVLGRPIEAVRAFTASMGERDFDTGAETGRFTPVNEDVFSAQLRFRGGVLGHVYATELAHGTFDEIVLQVDGTQRSASWTSLSPNQLTVAHKLEGVCTTGLATGTTSVSACISAVYGGSADALGVASFADGARNAAAMDAVRASAASGAWAELEELEERASSSFAGRVGPEMC